MKIAQKMLRMWTISIFCCLFIISCGSPTITGEINDDWGLIISTTGGVGFTGVGFTLNEHPEMEFLLYFEDVEGIEFTTAFSGVNQFEELAKGLVEISYEETEDGNYLVTSIRRHDQ